MNNLLITSLISGIIFIGIGLLLITNPYLKIIFNLLIIYTIFIIGFVIDIHDNIYVISFIIICLLMFILAGNIFDSQSYTHYLQKVRNASAQVKFSKSNLIKESFEGSGEGEEGEEGEEGGDKIVKSGMKEKKTVVPEGIINGSLPDLGNYEIRDYYWPCAWMSCATESSENGFVSMDALEHVLNLGYRGIHLGLWPDDDNNPTVQTDDMNVNGTPLDFEKVIEMIAEKAWTEDHNRTKAPLILYLELNQPNQDYLSKVWKILVDNLKNRLMGRKYSFNGRNNKYPICNIPIQECLGKVIILTNKYPTITGVLNEIVNGTIEGCYQYIKTLSYTQNMANKGLKNTISNLKQVNTQNLEYMTAVFPQPVPRTTELKVNFRDCWSYGCQLVWMPVFNYKPISTNWTQQYQTAFNDTCLILKPASLRKKPIPKKEVKKQDPNLSFEPKQTPVNEPTKGKLPSNNPSETGSASGALAQPSNVVVPSSTGPSAKIPNLS